jgi:hypothetical protein
MRFATGSLISEPCVYCIRAIWNTLWLFNIAIVNGPFIDDLLLLFTYKKMLISNGSVK